MKEKKERVHVDLWTQIIIAYLWLYCYDHMNRPLPDICTLKHVDFT